MHILKTRAFLRAVLASAATLFLVSTLCLSIGARRESTSDTIGSPWLGDRAYVPAAMRTERLKRWFAGAREARIAKDWPELIAECQRLLAEHPQDRAVQVLANFELANALRWHGFKLKEAIVALDRCVAAAEEGGTEYQAIEGFARHQRLLLQVGSKVLTREAAEAEARRLLAQFPDAPGASVSVDLVASRVQKQQGNAAAERYLRRLVEKHARQWVGLDALLLLARYRLAAGDKQEAIRCYQQLKAWAQGREDWAALVTFADQLIERVTRGPRPAPAPHPPPPDASDEEKAEWLLQSIPEPDWDSTTSDLEEYARAVRAMIEKCPDTVAAVRARLALAAAKAMLARKIREKRPEEAEALYREAVAIYDEVSQDPKAQTNPEVKRMAAGALIEKATILGHTLKDTEEAIRAYELIVERADSLADPRAMEALERMARAHAARGEVQRQISCLEKILANAALPEDAETLPPAVRFAATTLPIVYGEQVVPPRWDVSAACSRRMLEVYGEHLDERARAYLDRAVEVAETEAVKLAADERAAGYVHLWLKGYYKAMYALLVPEFRGKMRPEQFVAKLKALTEAGVRPKDIGDVVVVTADEAAATVKVHVEFDKDQPPAFVSGPITFRLVHAETEDVFPPALAWLIEAGPIPQ